MFSSCRDPLGLGFKEKLLVGESRKGLFTEYKDKHITGLKKYCPRMSVLVEGADNYLIRKKEYLI